MKADLDTWEEILSTITRNKSRSILTAFGVFWGIFMLAGMLGGGNGMQDMLSRNFSGFATNSAFIFPGQTGKAYKGFRKGRTWNLETADIERLRQAIPELDVITPVLARYNEKAVAGEHEYTCMLRGMYPDMGKVSENDIRFGRELNDIDITDERKVCVIGKDVYKQLFPEGGDPCGKIIKVGGIYYRVVGVNYGTSNINIGGNADETIQIPFPIMQKALHYGNRADMIALTAHGNYKISTLENRIKAVIARAHFIAPDDKQGVNVFSAEVMFTMMDNLFRGVRLLVWFVGLGTLLAGIVGVSNIMMVTVKERTTEIGIRRAIGARPKDILAQILLESLVLTIIAGASGISFAVFVLQCLEMGTAEEGVIQGNFQISFTLAVGAAIMLVLLGLFAGLAPALRALSIKPIDAIREE